MPAFGTLFTPAMALLSAGAQRLQVNQGLAFGMTNLAWAAGQAVAAAGSGALAQATSDFVPYSLLAAACLASLILLWRARRSRAAYMSRAKTVLTHYCVVDYRRRGRSLSRSGGAVVKATRAARSGPAGAGLALAVLSAATFGTSGTFASALIRAGWSPAAAVIIRIAMSALILTVPALLQLRGRWGLLRRAAPRVAVYGLLAVAGCQLFYFNALQRIPVGVALLLEYLGAVLVVLWAWLRHGQRPRRLTVTGAVSAIAGLVMVLNLTGTAHIDPVGVMWGLLAAVGLAVYFVLSAATAEPLPPIVMAWAGMCVGAAALGLLGLVGALPMKATAADVVFLGHRVSWLVPVLGLSLVAAVIAYVAGMGRPAGWEPSWPPLSA